MFNPIIAIGEPAAPVDPTLVNPGGSTYTPPSYQGSDPSGGDGGDGTPPETDSPCLDCTAESATMSCSGVVVRGATVTCTVSVGSGLASSMVRQWSWTSSPTAPISATVSGPERVLSWSGPAVAGGTVEVVVLEDGQARTLSAAFAVTERGWTWASRGVSEYRDGTGEACLDHTPSVGGQGEGNLVGTSGMNLEIGYGCATPHRMIQPDSWDTGDGFTTATAPGGPNQGLHYVASARLSLRRESTYNRGLLPAAAPVSLRDVPGYSLTDYHRSQRTLCGAQANWYQFSVCAGVDPAVYIQAVHLHEGHGSQGNNGHYSAAYHAVTDAANDPMIFLDETVGSNGVTAAQFTDNVRGGYRSRAGQADEAARHTWAGGRVGNNWAGQIWLWLPGEGRFSLERHAN